MVKCLFMFSLLHGHCGWKCSQYSCYISVSRYKERPPASRNRITFLLELLDMVHRIGIRSCLLLLPRVLLPKWHAWGFFFLLWRALESDAEICFYFPGRSAPFVWVCKTSDVQVVICCGTFFIYHHQLHKMFHHYLHCMGSNLAVQVIYWMFSFNVIECKVEYVVKCYSFTHMCSEVWIFRMYSSYIIKSFLVS